MRRTILSSSVLLGLVACVNSPDLPPAERPSRSEAPQLMPISGILEQAGSAPAATAQSMADVPQARAAALRARAARLRGDVLGADERTRMQASEDRLR